MIKLTTHNPAGHETMIHLEGRLDAQGLGEFRSLLEAAAIGPSLSIDLGGLLSVDSAGLALLLELRQRGCRLVGGSLYISRILGEVTQ